MISFPLANAHKGGIKQVQSGPMSVNKYREWQCVLYEFEFAGLWAGINSRAPEIFGGYSHFPQTAVKSSSTFSIIQM